MERVDINAISAMANELAEMKRRIADLERSTQRRGTVFFGNCAPGSATITPTVPSLVNQLPIAALGRSGWLYITAHVFLDGLTVGDVLDVKISLDVGSTSGNSGAWRSTVSFTANANIETAVHVTSGPARILGMFVERLAGGGSVHFYSDPNYNFMSALFVPD